MMRITKFLVATVATASLLALAACSSGGGGGGKVDKSPITLGMSVQLTGTWATGGNFAQQAVEKAVSDVNADGGIKVAGVKRKLEVKILDNRSDVPTVTDQTRSLIVDTGVDAMISPLVSDYSAAGAAVAEQYKVPYLVTGSPLVGFLAGNPSGWKYAWDNMYSENGQAQNAAKALSTLDTNKKVALMTDTSSDGVNQRAAFKTALKKAGFQVVSDQTYASGTTDFTTLVQQAKDSGADISIAVPSPADGSALIKAFKATNYVPKVDWFAKSGDGSIWPSIAGAAGLGATGENYWAPADRGPGSDKFITWLESQNIQPATWASMAFFYSLVQVYVAAVEHAGTTDKAAVNKALGEISVPTLSGTVKYAKNHTHQTKQYVLQWQGTPDSYKPVQVWPNPDAGVKWEIPPAGLAN